MSLATSCSEELVICTAVLICMHVMFYPDNVYMYQAAQDEEASNNNGQLATGRLRGSVDPMATNCSSPASSSPSFASLEQQAADDMCAPSLEISLGRRDWSVEERPEGVSLKYM